MIVMIVFLLKAFEKQIISVRFGSLFTAVVHNKLSVNWLAETRMPVVLPPASEQFIVPPSSMLFVSSSKLQKYYIC